MNRFVTEKEVEETKKKREEEWAEARAAGREIPVEEPHDSRCLYERLKEQKDKKQEEFEEQLKFKNMIYKGLNDEDASFLTMVAEKQAKIDAKRFDNESEEIKQYKAALDKVEMPTSHLTESKKVKVPNDYKKKGRSQAELMTTLVRKRKSSHDTSEKQDGKQKKPFLSKKTIEEETKSCPPVFPPVSKSNTEKTSLSALAQYSSSSDDEES